MSEALTPLTPMMAQYRRIRNELPRDTILFFRLGDFYEMFFEDAIEAAPILDVALTRRNEVPMCGVPYHAVDGYLARLIRAGRKVAICDQVEDPAQAKGIVKRDVTRIVTPGTVTEENILESGSHNYLAGLVEAGPGFALALMDLSTGLFTGEACATPDALRDALRRAQPAECVLPERLHGNADLLRDLRQAVGGAFSRCDDWVFEYDVARDNLLRHFGVTSLDGFGCEGQGAVVGAAGGLLHYVREDLRRHTGHVRGFRVVRSDEVLLLDEATCGNLDLFPPRGRSAAPSLLGVLDATCTPMGSRLLRDWLLRPAGRLETIVERHDAVEALARDRRRLAELRENLKFIRDLERLIGRIDAGTGNGRDLRALGVSLAALPAVRAGVQSYAATLLQTQAEQVRPLPELAGLIERAIVEEPPITIREGGVIRAGYSAELDELRTAASQGHQWLASYQAREIERTGIKTLKVRYNKVFGYYIEVSRGQTGNVPADYMRKQTLVNAERYITPELKEYENKILGAQERAVQLEHELFLAVREQVVTETASIQSSAAAVAVVDVLASLADRAAANNYVRPRMTAGTELNVDAGRHPVVEQMPEAERFVPNDTRLNCTDHQLIIITGPNMAGKSTYIRQVALIAVMAHAGSFVPARAAEIGVLDRVFTRVGASDDLARGRSTFMVEMQETANILNNATGRSLIVLDEIGRGTSTFDGISIAWAVAEFLHNSPRVKAKTLFATHYHELTDLAKTLPGVKNFNVLVKESGGRVVFLRRIVPGGADKSYGIAVAKLAGMPGEVIERAGEILANLEEGEFAESGQPKLARRRPVTIRVADTQLSLFQ